MWKVARSLDAADGVELGKWEEGRGGGEAK